MLSQLGVSCSVKNLLFCEACVSRKSHSQPFPLSTAHASAPLELIHTDLWGPSHEPSKDGFKYHIHLIDDFSRYTWIYPLKTKDQPFGFFFNLKLWLRFNLELLLRRFNQIGVVNTVLLLVFFIKMVFFFSIHALTLINRMVEQSKNIVTLLKWVLFYLLRLVCLLNFSGMPFILFFFL